LAIKEALPNVDVEDRHQGTTTRPWYPGKFIFWMAQYCKLPKHSEATMDAEGRQQINDIDIDSMGLYAKHMETVLGYPKGQLNQFNQIDLNGAEVDFAEAIHQANHTAMVNFPTKLLSILVTKVGEIMDMHSVRPLTMKFSSDFLASLRVLQDIWARIARNTFRDQTKRRTKHLEITTLGHKYKHFQPRWMLMYL